MGNFLPRNLLDRSNLRDLVVLLSFVSSIVCDMDYMRMTVGLAVLAIGCVLHLIAKGVLVRNVVLCSEGIYGMVRHPYYLANYLVDSGFCVLSGNPYLLLLYPFLFFWAYGPTLRKEEAFLSSAHADAFAEQSSQIPQVFPDRASLRGLKTFFEGFSITRITTKELARIAAFCSLGLFLILIHEIKMDGVSQGLLDVVRPTMDDYDEFLIALFAVTLLSASFIFRRRSTSEKA